MRHLLLHTITGTCLLLITWGLLSCNKEKELTPDTPPVFYTLPQGNHPYDEAIVAFNKKYGSYILYKFSQQEFAYDVTGTIPVLARPANEAYVQQTLDFFKSRCLDLYPETFLKKTLPFRILLAARLDTIRTTNTSASNINKFDTSRSVTGFAANRQMMSIGWADSTLLQQSPAQLKLLKGYMNRCYFQHALLSGAMEIPAAFIQMGPAGGYQSIVGYRPDKGMVEAPSSQDQGRNGSPTWDFLCYINMITSHTKAELEATVLSPAVDVNGLIRQKYDLLITYYRNQYGFDLQSVGNHQ